MKRAINIFVYISLVLFALSLVTLFAVRSAQAETVPVYGTTDCPDGFSQVMVGQKVGSVQTWNNYDSSKPNFAAGVYFTPDVCTPSHLAVQAGARVIIPCAICKRD